MAFLNQKEFKLFLLFFLVYLTFAQLSGWTASSRVDLAVAIAYDSTLNIDNIRAEPIFNTLEVIKVNGHYYIEDAPGDSFLALPITFLFRMLFGYPQADYLKWCMIYLMVASVSCLAGALTCVLVYKSLRFYTQKESHKLLVTLAYGLGTSGIFISTRIIGEATATLFAFFSFYLLLRMWKEQNQSRSCFFFSGVLGGLAILSSYESGLVVVICLAFAFFFRQNRLRNVFLFLTGLTMILCVLFLYNYAIFQNPFDTGFFHDRGDDTLSKTHPLLDLSEKPVLLKYLSMFRLMSAPGLELTDGLKVILSNIVHLLFFSYRGLFVYSSFLIFSFIGLSLMGKKNRAEQIMIFVIFLFILFFAASNLTWWAYEGLSCRRMSFAIPFLMMPLAHLLSLNKYRKLIILTAVLSMLVHILGMQTPIDYGFFYESKRLLMKHTFLCMYQNIANPVKDFYLPLFIKFGPRSLFIEMILGKRLPPFLNLIGLSFLAVILWYGWFKKFLFKHKKLFLIILALICVLAGLRIAFSSEATKY